MLRRFGFTTVMVMLLVVLGISFQNIHAQTTPDASQIEAVVREYFDLLHEGRAALSPQDFSHLVAATPDAVTFLKAEEDKRQVEYYQARLFRLNYEDASFRLDFHPIEINESTLTATVSVDEWQEIVFEVSSPVVSKAHIEHTFSLLLEDNEWHIVSDNYLDPVRRFLNVTGYSKGEAIQSLDDQNAATQREAEELGPAAVIQGTYNASAAVSYAHTYWSSYNPNYYDFGGIGGDCTNFVSQAIGDSGGAAVPQDYHSNGWYYNSVNDRAPAWTSVPSLFTFITSTSKLSGYTGPEGNSTDSSGVTTGDVIQYSDCAGWWGHSVIIVGYSGGHLVAAHDDDVDNYPYTSIPGCRRYIHITGY